MPSEQVGIVQVKYFEDKVLCLRFGCQWSVAAQLLKGYCLCCVGLQVGSNSFLALLPHGLVLLLKDAHPQELLEL